MCTQKEILRDNILTGMQPFLNAPLMEILNQVVVQALFGLEVTESETLLATIDDTNQRIIAIYMTKKAPKLSPKTVEYYMLTIRNFIEFVQKSLLDVSDMDVEFYLQSYSRKGNQASTINNARRNLSAFFTWMRKSQSTINNERRNLSAFFTWMRKSHLRSDNPVDSVEPYREMDKPIDHLTDGELEALRDACKVKVRNKVTDLDEYKESLRDRALLEFLRSTAVRVSECVSVNVQDINWQSGELMVYGQKNRTWRTVCLDDTAKYHLKKYIDSRNDKEPALFISSKRDHKRLAKPGIESAIGRIAERSGLKRRVYPHLFSRNDKEPALFISSKRDHKRLAKPGIESAIGRIAERSGLKRRVYPHLFRKTTATNMVKRGCPRELVAFYLGHKNGDARTLNKHYAATTPDQVLGAFRKYGAAA